MQITLIQVEIEEAIRRFVASQINVREGMRIDIELKATRGAEGYQAYIDIVEQNAERKIGNGDDAGEADAPAPVATPVKVTASATPAPTVTKAAPVRTTTRKANPPVPAEPPVVAQAEEPAAVEDQGVPEEQSILDQPDGVAEDAGEDTVGVVEEAAPAAPVRSLFGGLTRPSNS